MKIEKKNIVLRQSGVPNDYSVYELETEMQDGTKRIWIPEDRYELKPLRVTKNGHYSARNYNCDGFSNVIVNIQLPYSGVTRNGIEYEIYEDTTGKPHITVKKGDS